MTRARKASFAVTSRYAIALIELAQDSGKMQAVEGDLSDLAAMLARSPDLAALVHAPSANRQGQAAAINALAEKAGLDGLTRNFLNVLIQNRRLYALEGIIEAVKSELSRQRGEIAVQVETAQDLSEGQKKALQDSLTKGLGQKVLLKAKVEPGILGGMIVTVGSKMIDDSVRRKLERMKLAMGKQSNENTTANTKEVG